MIFRKKLKEDNPNLTEKEINKRVLHSCPYVYGYGGETVNSKCMNDGKVGSHCIECWNREMPNTEPNVEEDKEWLDGYEKGKIDGLNDAWELAKKISCVPSRGGYSSMELEEIFGTPSVADIFENVTPQEALAKLKAYEEAQSKIEVGDVVNFKENVFVVIRKDFDSVLGIDRNVETWETVIEECK